LALHAVSAHFLGLLHAFWQEFIILPIYIHEYVNANSNTEALLSWDALQ